MVHSLLINPNLMLECCTCNSVLAFYLSAVWSSYRWAGVDFCTCLNDPLHTCKSKSELERSFFFFFFFLLNLGLCPRFTPADRRLRNLLSCDLTARKRGKRGLRLPQGHFCVFNETIIHWILQIYVGLFSGLVPFWAFLRFLPVCAPILQVLRFPPAKHAH